MPRFVSRGVCDIRDSEDRYILKGSQSGTGTGLMADSSGTVGINESCPDGNGTGVVGDLVLRHGLRSDRERGSPVMEKSWYVVHTLTGQEEKVRSALEKTKAEGEEKSVSSDLLGSVVFSKAQFGRGAHEGGNPRASHW